jgi:hypothetical protein
MRRPRVRPLAPPQADDGFMKSWMAGSRKSEFDTYSQPPEPLSLNSTSAASDAEQLSTAVPSERTSMSPDISAGQATPVTPIQLRTSSGTFPSTLTQESVDPGGVASCSGGRPAASEEGGAKGETAVDDNDKHLINFENESNESARDLMNTWVNGVAKSLHDEAEIATAVESEQSFQARDKKDGDLVKALATSIKVGEVDVRGFLGSRWQRHLLDDKKEGAKYKSEGSTAAKKEFRLKWAASLLAQKATQQIKKTSHIKIDSELIRFMSLDRVIKEEGGRHNKANIKAAYEYLLEAKKIGSTLLR